VVTAAHAADHLVEVDGTVHRVTKDEGGVLRSPAPALVVSVNVAVGDEVAAGAPIVVLESMKMETVLPRPSPAGSRSCSSRPTTRWGRGNRCCGSSPSAPRP
jgi:biotin carboxyl carrier protein